MTNAFLNPENPVVITALYQQLNDLADYLGAETDDNLCFQRAGAEHFFAQFTLPQLSTLHRRCSRFCSRI